MQIPKKFNLAGLTITVETDNTMIANKKIIGEARYNSQKITMDMEGACREMTEQSFLHELVHWIFYVMGEDKLRCNERVVDLFAQFLYQYEQSKVFEEE